MRIRFRDMQIISRFIGPTLLACALGLLCACETPKQRGSATSKASRNAVDEEEKEYDKVQLEAPLKILRVNPDYGWVVVQSPKALISGMQLSTWHGDEETAKLMVAERNRHPFYILEVSAGDPHPNDTLTIGAGSARVIDANSEAAEEGPVAVPGENVPPILGDEPIMVVPTGQTTEPPGGAMGETPEVLGDNLGRDPDAPILVVPEGMTPSGSQVFRP